MKQRLIAIVGPTAVGKTVVGVNLCLRLGGEVISGDSMQVYRGMDIGTAKIPPSEMCGIPHHLIDIRTPAEPFSVAQFQMLVDDAGAGIAARGAWPVLVGGTGLYVRSVLQEYSFPAVEGDPDLRRELDRLEDAHGPGYLHRRLGEVDPTAANRLHPHDRRRLIRALEVHQLTGHPISRTQTASESEPRYDYLLVVLTGDREWLYDRIDKRVDLMLEQGWVEETRALLRMFDHRLPALQALGYKEIGLYLKGFMTFAEMRLLIQRNTRRFAKRQLTWFRREPAAHWVETGPSRTTQDIVEEIARLVEGKWGSA